MGVSSYIDYFRQIAINHPQLQHNVATESGGDGNKAFSRFSPDEIVTGLRNQVGEKALMLELYETDMNGEPFSIQKKMSGAFSIIQRGAPNNLTIEETCFTNAEAIMEDVLQTIWDDHYGPNKNRCDTPFFLFDFNGISVIPVGPLFNYYFGYRCEFSFRMKTSYIT